jgi:RNA polymerase sigma-70 factor, ECF subfamily
MLTTVFVGALRTGTPLGFVEPALEGFLHQMIDRAHGKHRALASGLTAEQFVTHVAERLRPQGSLLSALRATHTDDLFLACAALAGSTSAHQILGELLEREVTQVVRRQPPGLALAEEVNQILFSQLLLGQDERGPKLREYSGRGPIGAWVRASALGVALNLRRQDRPAEPLSGEFDAEDLEIAADDPEIAYMRALCRSEFSSAFVRALATLEPRERNLLRLRFLDTLTLEEVAAYFRVHRATVVRWLSEVTSRLFEETRRELGDRLSLDQPEVDSLLRAARSRIDFSLRGLFRRAEEGEAIEIAERA